MFEEFHLDIADFAMRQLCAQALSATSENAFSKAKLVVRNKRQWLKVDHVDGTDSLRWHYKDNGGGE